MKIVARQVRSLLSFSVRPSRLCGKVISNKDHTDLSVILNEVKDLLFRQKQILRCRSE